MRSTAIMQVPRSLQRLFRPVITRRKHTRTPVALTVDWHLPGSGVHHRTTTEDFSRAGTSVSAFCPPPVGSPVHFSIVTPSGWLELIARVAWSDPSRMGLSFEYDAASV